MFVSIKGKEVKGGSSPSRQFLLHVPTNTEWVCKCSELGIIKMNEDYITPNLLTPTDSISEYKEVLALRLYSFFEVPTPQTVLSRQLITQEAKNMFG